MLTKKLKNILVSINVITIVSFILLVYFTYDATTKLDLKFILFFTFFFAVAESLPIFYKELALSTSFAILLSTFILKGPLVTIIVVVLGFSIRVLKYNGKLEHIFNTPWFRTTFNYCIFTLPIIVSGMVFQILGGDFHKTIYDNLLPILAFTLVNYLMSIFMISAVTSVLSNNSFFYSYLRNAKLGIFNLTIIAPLGIMAAHIFASFSYAGLILFFIPVILTRFILASMIHANQKYMQTVNVIMNALEARDSYTRGHSKRVAEISILIAKELKYNEWQIDTLTIGAMLHDIGKIGISDNILNKMGQLTDEEFHTIKTHPEIGFSILKDIQGMRNVLRIVRSHHERYDGNGYPDGKTHHQLPLNVYIVQLADTIDAMATDRPYRKALNDHQIIEEIIKHKGTQFHPKVVDAYLRTRSSAV